MNTNKLLASSFLRRAIVQSQFRTFGPKAKAGGGPVTEVYVPPVIHKTNFETLIEEKGMDAFLFGPPSGVSKRHQSHRDYILPKVGQKMEIVAKKFREQYVREAIYPDVKIYLDALRERNLDDTLQNLHRQQLVAACITGRDEFEELDLVMPHRTPFTITRADHGLQRPFWVRHNEDEIMVTPTRIHDHFRTTEPVLIDFQRYIVGRPNLLTLPLWPVQEDKSLHFQAGAKFHFLQRTIKVWCYNSSWPAVIEVDCKDLSPQMSIKIGDIERQLPHGMFLHKDNAKARFHSVVKLTETNMYIQRKNQVIEQADLIRDAKKDLQTKLLDKNAGRKQRTAGMQVPKYVQGSKGIMQEKKEAQAGMNDKGEKKK